MMKSNLITVEGNFNRYIYESDKDDFFIANIVLKPYAMDRLKEFVKNINIYSDKEEAFNVNNQIVLKGNSENFKKTIEDRISEYSFTVKPVYESKYDQFQLELVTFFEKVPTSEAAMVKFLTKKVATIGQALAKRIIEHFGLENVEQVFNNSPEKLLEVRGIKASNLEKITDSWNENRFVFEILNYLKDFEVSDTTGLKIFQKFNKKSLEIIQKDPYKLCLIDGITFLTADSIAIYNGMKKEDPNRIIFAINYALKNLINMSGDTVIQVDKLLSESVKLLDLPASLVLGFINALIEKGKVKEISLIGSDSKYCTLPSIYNLEKNILNIVLELVGNNRKIKFFTQASIDEFKNKNEYGLDYSQMEAAINIFNNSFNVLTGGPGTGKTKTIQAIIQHFFKHDRSVLLLAPTGKAAQRLSESTGYAASTLHRFLKIAPNFEQIANVSLDEELLDYDLVVIDESSMLDLPLIYSLLKRININRTSVLMVGDTNQLEPVGYGYFFRDIIQSGLVNVSKLEVLHRQTKDSNIAINAEHIRKKRNLDLGSSHDFEFIEIDNNEKIALKINEIYDELHNNQGVSNLDIQIISPVREKALSAKELNKMIRPIANSNYDEEQEKSKVKYIVGDKVMQMENNYDLMVFNGDTGIVKNYDIANNKTIIEFGNPNFKVEQVEYETKLLSQLDLAYCITVHKSQGSDYPYVIIPLSRNHSRMWSRRLLYTALTRAKKKVYLIGSKSVVKSINHEFKNRERITNLSNFFKMEIV